ncbi:MAG TPA: T9SS type A sorting domain-containing protein [Ignavibacteriaceae bacterium]|nr:T9SS type A sorting domain-containing protein [Ignavibacteriaceae bacterium]
MKKTFILFFIISSLVYSQVGWQVKNPEIYFLDNNIGWILTAVKDNKSITIKTTNAGETWEIQKIDTFKNYGLWFYNDSIGFAKYLYIHYPDINYPLYKTIDKGKTWQINPFGNYDIVDFYFFRDGNTGYGIQYLIDSTNNKKQYFSRTTNGGLTWDTLSYLGSRNYDNISLSIGWVLNHNNILLIAFSYGRPFTQTILKSKDGGYTWLSCGTLSLGDVGTGGISGLCFADTNIGYLEFHSEASNGNPDGRYKTRDGGTTWMQDSSYIGAGTLFVDSLNGFNVFDGWEGNLNKTTNKGESWNFVNKIIYSYFPFIGFSALTFLDENNGFAQKSIFEDEIHWRNEFCKTTDGGYTWSCSPIVFDTSALITAIEETHILLTEYKLEQNYPNPFNPSTKISFSLPEGGLTTIKVYDILGEEKATILNEYKQAGSYTTTFVGKNLPSGVYIYTITSGSFKQSRKMLLMK